jgi:hypothetical protein
MRRRSVDPAPPGWVGRYTDEFEVNVANDSQLDDAASWALHLGRPASSCGSVRVGLETTAADAWSPLGLAL